MAPPKAFEVID